MRLTVCSRGAGRVPFSTPQRYGAGREIRRARSACGTPTSIRIDRTVRPKLRGEHSSMTALHAAGISPNEAICSQSIGAIVPLTSHIGKAVFGFGTQLIERVHALNSVARGVSCTRSDKLIAHAKNDLQKVFFRKSSENHSGSFFTRALRLLLKSGKTGVAQACGQMLGELVCQKAACCASISLLSERRRNKLSNGGKRAARVSAARSTDSRSPLRWAPTRRCSPSRSAWPRTRSAWARRRSLSLRTPSHWPRTRTRA